MEFTTQKRETIEKMTKANNLLKYMNNVGKRMEINTALLLYKVLVRSIFDYGNMFFFPDLEIQKEKMEKIQYQGLRTALGYRNSTPKNVILEEAKIVNLKEKAVFF